MKVRITNGQWSKAFALGTTGKAGNITTCKDGDQYEVCIEYCCASVTLPLSPNVHAVEPIRQRCYGVLILQLGIQNHLSRNILTHIIYILPKYTVINKTQVRLNYAFRI